METQRKGDIGVTQAIAKFTALGYNVSIPITESAPYDLIVEKGGKLKKVQVKYSSKVDVDLRRIHSNSKGYVVKQYGKTFDWLFVFKDNTCYLIKEDLSKQGSVRVKDKHII